MFQLAKVGEQHTFFKGYESMLGSDGGRFEALESGGYVMNIYINRLKPLEIQAFGNLAISVRIISESNFVLALARFGNTSLIFEMDLDPTLYKDDRALQLGLKNNIVTFIVVESTNNIIQVIRSANMPLKLREKWLVSWMKAKEIDNYSQRYANWMRDLRSRYTVEQLWDRGLYIGKFGEKLGD